MEKACIPVDLTNLLCLRTSPVADDKVIHVALTSAPGQGAPLCPGEKLPDVTNP